MYRTKALERSQTWLEELTPIGGSRITHTILIEHARALLDAETEVARLREALEKIKSDDTFMLTFANGVRAPGLGGCAKTAQAALAAHAKGRASLT